MKKIENKLRKTVMFLEEECTVYLSKYQNNDRPSIQLFVKETGEPMATASVNLPEFPIAPYHVALKTYSGNEGLMEILQEAGIIGPVDYTLNNTFMDFPVCKILVTDEDIDDGYLNASELEKGKTYWVDNGHWEFKVLEVKEDHFEIKITGFNKKEIMPFKDFKDYYRIKKQ